MADDNDTNDETTNRDIPLDADELQARFGNQERVIQKLINKVDALEADNAGYRSQIRDLKQEIPDEQATVLGPDEADQLRELGAIGEDGTVQADQLQERMSEAKQAEQELQRLRQKEKRREVYEATGLNAEAAEDILPDDVEYETETVDTEDGEETKAFVQTEDGRQEVGEYVEESFSEPIQDALYADQSGGEDEEESTGKPVPSQTPAGEDDPGDSEPDEDEIRQQKLQQINYGV